MPRARPGKRSAHRPPSPNKQPTRRQPFGDLLRRDKAGFILTNGSGTVIYNMYVDYLATDGTRSSGYGSGGVGPLPQVQQNDDSMNDVPNYSAGTISDPSGVHFVTADLTAFGAKAVAEETCQVCCHGDRSKVGDG